MQPFFPPRPGITLYWPFLGEYEKKGWVAQRKFNGQRNLVYISAERDVELWSRHEDNGFEHLNYELSADQRRLILGLNLPKGQDVVLDSELLHRKTKGHAGANVAEKWRQGCRDTIVLFDILYAGKYLSFWSQKDRLQLLNDICGDPKAREPGGRALIVNDRLWLAERFNSDFIPHFNEMLECPEIEGVVLRKLDSKLIQNNPTCGQKKHEVSWMVRVRKPNPNYHH